MSPLFVLLCMSCACVSCFFSPGRYQDMIFVHIVYTSGTNQVDIFSATTFWIDATIYTCSVDSSSTRFYINTKMSLDTVTPPDYCKKKAPWTFSISFQHIANMCPQQTMIFRRLEQSPTRVPRETTYCHETETKNKQGVYKNKTWQDCSTPVGKQRHASKMMSGCRNAQYK